MTDEELLESFVNYQSVVYDPGVVPDYTPVACTITGIRRSQGRAIYGNSFCAWGYKENYSKPTPAFNAGR